MSVSQESRNVLEEMRKAGVDATILAGLERELDSKPAVDQVVKSQLLAQAGFNDYRTRKDKEIEKLKTDLTRLASLQASSGNLEGDLKTSVEAQIIAKEKELIDQGYDIEQVRSLVSDLLSNPANIGKLDNPPAKKDEPMPENNKYVDTKTFTDVMQTGLTNLAAGGINMSVEIARALHEADKLGIELTPEKLDTFGQVMIKGLESGKTPAQIKDEHFGFSTVRAEKDKTAREAELKAAEEKGRREALKEVGVSPRANLRDKERNPNLILDRQKHEKLDSRITDPEKLPKNEKGDLEVFRTRRFDRQQRRHEHTQNAVTRYDEVKQDYDDDGLYIGHRRAAND